MVKVRPSHFKHDSLLPTYHSIFPFKDSTAELCALKKQQPQPQPQQPQRQPRPQQQPQQQQQPQLR